MLAPLDTSRRASPAAGDAALHRGDGAAGFAPIAPPESAPRRIAHLDLLRAAAILPVVAVNLVAQDVVDLGPWGNHVLESGWVGVDLFFVLSGWLIGGLYWREHARFGGVEVGRFWARRWLRTIPPYLAALLAVGLATVVMGGDAPSWHYAVFAQNYLDPIPMWAVSWSLCVEEHFYLALPLVLGVALRVRWGVPLVLGAAVLLSLGARLLTVPDGAASWGVGYTATHLRLEGLALGVAAAAVRVRRPDVWPALRRGATWLALPALAMVASVPWMTADVVNQWAFLAVDVAFVVLLIAVVDRRALPLAASRVVRAVAFTSYSVYMTHTVVLNAYHRVAQDAVALPPAVHVAAALVCVAAVGGVFYVWVERPSVRLRDRWAPRR